MISVMYVCSVHYVFRYAMSVMWQLDAASLEVCKVWYGRTLIRSSYQLHYELAQSLLNGEDAEVPELSRLQVWHVFVVCLFVCSCDACVHNIVGVW